MMADFYTMYSDLKVGLADVFRRKVLSPASELLFCLIFLAAEIKTQHIFLHFFRSLNGSLPPIGHNVDLRIYSFVTRNASGAVLKL